MTHLGSIGAGVFSDLAIATPETGLTATTLKALDTLSEFAAFFASEVENVGGVAASGAFVRVTNVREFPSLGVPPNIVNVPVFGSKTSFQTQGQSDSPSLEISLNFIASDWASTGTLLGAMVGDGKLKLFRFALLNTEPAGSGATKYAQAAAGLGAVENSVYFFGGKVEALVIQPQLTDANQATLTLSMQTSFFGAYTTDGV
jgi:hypothetical protein